MSEARQTTLFAGAALGLLLVVWMTAPRTAAPRALTDRGELLFQHFTDPNAAASLEVSEFDPQSGTVRSLKVRNQGGRWTIPSQHDYPADAGDRLAQTAASLIALRKDDFASDDAVDYERCGVLDPLDSTLPNLTGRGARLTIRGDQGQVLADIIIGNVVEHHPGFRYVRQPGQRRVYSSAIGDLKISTAFADWIERDLLQVTKDEIDAVNIRNYSLDRTTGRVTPGDVLLLQRVGESWTASGISSSDLDLSAVDSLLSHLTDLKIVGVLPKPAGISATLSRDVANTAITRDDQADLARQGFYLASNGQLLSNRGEVVIRTRKGVFYTLLFGEVALGVDLPATITSTPPDTTITENRYLFVVAEFDARSARTAGQAEEGAAIVARLRARFAPWYYVIAAESFARIQRTRTDFVKRARRGTAKE